MWQAIQLVTSGLALVAFIWAGVVAVLRTQIKHREKLILAANERDRPALVQQELENYYPAVEVPKLPLKAQTQLALERMRADLKRFQIKAIVVSLVAVLFTGVATFAILRASAQPVRSPKDPCDVPLDQRPLGCPL